MKINKKDLDKLVTNDNGVTIAYTGSVTFYKQNSEDDSTTTKFEIIEEFNESELNECFNKWSNRQYEVFNDFGYITLSNGGIVYFYLGNGVDELYQILGKKYEVE
jgi:hypothetical protein